MTRRSTCSFAFLLAVAWCCILGHAVHAQDTCDPDGSLAAACSDASMACQAECTDANDLTCFTDCGQALATCAQDIVENCAGASSNPCDPDGSLALACATAQSDCQAACAQEDSSNLDCFSACGEDLQKCANEIVNNCSGSANGGGEDPDGGGGTDGAQGGDDGGDGDGTVGTPDFGSCDPGFASTMACGETASSCQEACGANDTTCLATCQEEALTCISTILIDCGLITDSTTCDPDGALTVACSSDFGECRSSCGTEDGSCLSDCAQGIIECLSDIVENCDATVAGGGGDGENPDDNGVEDPDNGEESPDNNGGEDPDNDGEETPDDNGGGEDPGSDGGETPDDNGGGEAGDNDGEATPYDNDGGEDPDNDGGETPDGNGEDNGGGGTPQGGGVIDSPTTTSSQEAGNETSEAPITSLGKTAVFLIPSLTLL
jgi:hypothetical protein